MYQASDHYEIITKLEFPAVFLNYQASYFEKRIEKATTQLELTLINRQLEEIIKDNLYQLN